ncbi:MAG: PKD domain-containing protein [Candidatus Omnitrophica bacterium]|nr:PKD domain-containing protein [Candidatus Omnitrophota bacterium]MDD5661626.1 PKD domain-containing protein [Candidatus Omnitrophota bacterium]
MTGSKIQVFIVLSALLLSGCATYSVQKGESPYNKGYVVARYGRVLPEYTLGKDNSVPDEQVARERFQRRKKQVEAYYKKMGYIENRFKQNFVDPPIFMLQAVIGVLRMPAVAIRDYKYNHDPQYKEKIDKQEDAEYKAEKERVKAIKDQLSAYIQEDLQKEASVLGQAEDKAPAVIAAKVEKKAVPPPPPVKAEEKIESPVAAKAGEKTEPLAVAKVEKKPAQKKAVKPQIAYKAPKAVIVARPVKGASPLKVQFYGSRSSSPNGRISAYAWDFGDGDTSTQKNPINTYWSATYGSRQFTATLTVTDNKGIAASTSTVIEVIAQ